MNFQNIICRNWEELWRISCSVPYDIKANNNAPHYKSNYIRFQMPHLLQLNVMCPMLKSTMIINVVNNH